jgi:hypothetical protein
MPTVTLDIGMKSQIIGELVFTGTNDIGPKVVITLPLVQFGPSAAIGFIQDEWGQLELTGDVLADPTTGSFGTLEHPDDAMVSPTTDAYYVGTGIITWKGDDDLTARDVGNVNVFELTPTVERLDHWNHRVGGIRKKDFSPVVQQTLEVHMIMDEFTAENLKMALLASVATGTTTAGAPRAAA